MSEFYRNPLLVTVDMPEYTGNELFFENALPILIVDEDGNPVDIGGGGSSLIQINEQTADYILVLSDSSKVIEMNSDSANSVIIPPNDDVEFPVGTIIEVIQTGTGQTTINTGDDVTLTAPDGHVSLRVQWSSCSLRKRGTNSWTLIGDME